MNDYLEEDISSKEDKSSHEFSYQSSQWKVMLFHHEKQPACGKEIFTLDEFVDTYSHLPGIDFDNVCNNIE